MKNVFSMILAALALCACTRESQESNLVRLSVSCDEGAKISLNGQKQTVWNKGDNVSVFYAGRSENICALYMGEDGSKTGEIRFESPSGASGTKYALIPYLAQNSISGTVLRTEIPSEQSYREGSYADKSAVLVAASSGNSMNFSYVTSVIEVKVESSSSYPISIKSVTLSSAKGESIAGNVSVDMADPKLPLISLSSGVSSICLSGETSMATIPSKGTMSFFFSVAPVLLSGGYSVDILLSNGEHRTAKSTFATDLQPGNLYSVETTITQLYPVIIDFHTTRFTPSIPSERTAVGNDGKTHFFTNASDGKTYTISAGHKSAGYYYMKSVNGYNCLRFDEVGSWLCLPVMEGMKLARFGAMVRQQSGKGLSVSTTKTANGDILPVMEYQNGEMVYSSIMRDVTAPFYLHLPSNNTQISRIELYFE